MNTYTQLTLTDRQLISQMRQSHLNVPQMSKILKRSPSTIYREIKRNALVPGQYDVEKAHRKCTQRRHLSKKPTILTPSTIRWIHHGLIELFSPEQIAFTMTAAGFPISHETIYRYIWRDRAEGGTWYRQLRQATKRRRKRYGRYDSRGRLAGKRMIDERPKHILNRQEIGHWEADTVLGRGSKHCILTLVERKTGFTLIGKLVARTVENLNERMISLIKGRGDLPVRSITMDNGTEFHGYKNIESALGIPIYFARPYHSWERGTNENTNGLIRQYLPKHKSMARINQHTCNAIAHHLNQRPRKRHQFRTPQDLIYAM